MLRKNSSTSDKMRVAWGAGCSAYRSVHTASVVDFDASWFRYLVSHISPPRLFLPVRDMRYMASSHVPLHGFLAILSLRLLV